MLLPVAAWLVLFAQATPPPVSAIKTRLDAYERRAEQGNTDPAELAAIGRLVIDRARVSPRFDVWSPACAVRTVPDATGCTARLRAVTEKSAEPLSRRVDAAAALVARGEASGAAILAKLLEPLETARLASLTRVITLLPAERAVPLLTRLLASSSAQDQEAGCRAAGSFDAPEIRAALSNVVTALPPGIETWLICNVARGRLGERDAVGALWGYSHDLRAPDQLYAASAMLGTGDSRGVELLAELTHRAAMDVRVSAAELLAERDPDTAAGVADTAELASDPQIRAAALGIERRLTRVPPTTVRRMLVDPAELVQIVAAEVVIEWANRQKSR